MFYREAAEGAKASPSLNVHGAEVTSSQVSEKQSSGFSCLIVALRVHGILKVLLTVSLCRLATLMDVPSIFCSSYPAQSHKEPEAYPRWFRAQGRERPGRGRNSPTHSHNLEISLFLPLVLREHRGKPEAWDENANSTKTWQRWKSNPKPRNHTFTPRSHLNSQSFQTCGFVSEVSRSVISAQTKRPFKLTFHNVNISCHAELLLNKFTCFSERSALFSAQSWCNETQAGLYAFVY